MARSDGLDVAGWTADFEAVIDAAQPAGPVTLLGISQGSVACIVYALRHPERVSRLDPLRRLCARRVPARHAGMRRRPIARSSSSRASAWGSDNPSFRQVFTSRFIPDGTPDQLALVQRALPQVDDGRGRGAAARRAGARWTSSRCSRQVRVPTLVLHARDDAVVPVSEGRLLASGIPGAEFVELDSRNHVLLEDEPAWGRFQEAVLEFLGPGQGSGAAVFESLSAREREVLALMGDGLGNADIAARLKISDKTVRNHASNIFDKLGVWSRAQAIVFARDRGFRPIKGDAPLFVA